jgi:hypothetical protein
MVRRIGKVASTAVLLVVFFAVEQPASAQQKRATKEKNAAANKEKVESKVADAKKPAMRLPMYYTSVVTEEQHGKIATAYAKYNAKLAKLRAEIEEVTTERNAAMEEMLTPSQRTKVAELREEAKAKREKTAAK